MTLKELFVSPNYYRVGIDETGNGVIAVTITAVAWYEIYFRLTDDELASVKTDPRALDDLAKRLAVDKGKRLYADRLLESDRV